MNIEYLRKLWLNSAKNCGLNELLFDESGKKINLFKFIAHSVGFTAIKSINLKNIFHYLKSNNG